jgi:hypothetical protein
MCRTEQRRQDIQSGFFHFEPARLAHPKRAPEVLIPPEHIGIHSSVRGPEGRLGPVATRPAADSKNLKDDFRRKGQNGAVVAYACRVAYPVTLTPVEKDGLIRLAENQPSTSMLHEQPGAGEHDLVGTGLLLCSARIPPAPASDIGYCDQFPSVESFSPETRHGRPMWHGGECWVWS